MTLVINTVSDSTKAQKDLADLKKSVSGIETSVQKVTDSFGKLATGIAAAGASFAAAKTFLGMSDTMTNLENKLKAVTTSTDQYKKALQGVKDLALSTRSDMAATAALYQRIAINQKEIGINTKDTLRVVEIVNKSLKIAGSSAVEATSALLQFGQALGSGKLQGDELRSLAENAPTLFKAIADGINIPIGKMKEFGEKGKLTTSVIIPAIMKAGADVDRVFSSLTVTYGDAFENLGTAFTQLKDSASKYFFGSKNALATWLNDVAMSAGKVTKYFGYYMTLARSSVALFVFNAILLFRELLPGVVDIAKKIGSVAVGLFEKWAPNLKQAGDGLKQWLYKLGDVFSSTLALVGANLKANTFFAPLLSTFETVKNFIKDSLSSIWDTIGVNSIDVADFFKNFDPVKKMVKSFVHTIERAFFWLYDRVIGHSWIPDLVEGVENWMNKLLKKPLEFVKRFTVQVSNLFEKISSPLKNASMSSFVDTLKYGVSDAGKLLSKLGSIFSGDKSSFFDRVFNKLKELVKPKSTIDELRDKFKEAIEPKSKLQQLSDKIAKKLKPEGGLSAIGSNLSDLFSVKSPFQKIKDGLGNAVDGVLSSMGIAIQGIVDLTPAKLRVPLAAAATFAFASALSGLSSNPGVKTGLFALGTAIGSATSIKFLSPQDVSEAAYGFVATVATLMSDLFNKLLGGNAILNPLGLLGLLAKFALLFAAGRKMLGEVAGRIAQAPTRLGQNLGARIDLKVAEKDEARLKRELQTLPARLSASVAATSQAFTDRQRDLRTVLNQQTLARQTGGVGPDVAAALRAVVNARREMNAARSDLANIGTLRAGLTQGISDQRVRGLQIRASLSDAADTARERFRLNSGVVGGLVGGVGGIQLGTEFLKVIPNAPEWVKVASVISAGFIGQVAGSTIASALASGVTTILKGAGDIIAKTLSVVPWWLQAVIGIAGALYVGYELFQSLPDSWSTAIKKKFGFGGDDGTAPMKVSDWTDLALYVGIAVTGFKALSTSFPNMYAWIKNLFTPSAFPPLHGTFRAQMTIWISAFVAGIRNMIPSFITSLGPKFASVFSSGMMQSIKNGIASITPGLWTKLAALLVLGLAGKKAVAGDEAVEPDQSNRLPSERHIKPLIIGSTLGVVTNDFSDTEGDKERRKKAAEENARRDAAFNRRQVSGKIGDINAPILRDYDIASETKRMLSKVTGDLRNESIDTRRLDIKKPGLVDEFAGWTDTQLADLASNLKDGSRGKEMLTSLREYIKKLRESKEISLPENPVLAATGKNGGVAAAAEKVFSSSLKGLNNDAIGKNIAGYLNAKGFVNVDGAAIADAATRDPATVGMLANMIDRLERLDIATAKLGGPSDIIGAAADREAGMVRREIDNFMIGNLDFKEPGSKLKNESDGEDGAAAKKGKFDRFAEIFANIGKQFPKLQLTFEDFLNMETTKALAVADLAKQAANDINTLNAKNIGKRNAGVVTAEDIQEQKDIAARNKGRAEQAEAVVRPTRSSAANLMPLFNEVQANLTEDVLNALRDGTLKGLETSAKTVKDLKESLNKTPDIASNEDTRIQLAEQLAAAVKDLQTKVRNATVEAASSFEKASLLGSTNGVDISRGLYNRLSQIERDALQRTLVLLESKQNAANAVNLAPAVSKKIQEEVDAIRQVLNTELVTKGVLLGEESGKAFASGLKSDFASAFGGALRGQRDENRSVLMTMFDRMMMSVSNGILDTFTRSFTDSLMGEGSPIFGFLKSLGVDVSSWATSLGGGGKSITDATKGMAGSDAAFDKATGKGGLGETLEKGWKGLKDTLGGAWTGLSDILSGSWDSLSKLLMSGIQSLMGAFGGGGGGGGSSGLLSSLFSDGAGEAAGAIMGAFGINFAATGGRVVGSGSGTSDSIPAMLSNGEFIVNAKQAGRFTPLLHAINSGHLARFADGGLVSNAPRMIDISSSVAQRGSNQQVINISITGDISRQTRKEIYGMMPAIAAGVNNSNHERGYRG